MDSLHTTLRQYILNRFFEGQSFVGFDDDYDLVENGILDSLAMIGLITHLENEYQFEFDDQDFQPENFNSVNAIQAFVTRKTQAVA